MSASSKKSPLTMTKKKKASTACAKSKKNGGNKKAKYKDMVISKDESNLSDGIPSMSAATDIPSHSVPVTSVSVDQTVFNILSRLEQSHSELIRWMERLERNTRG